MRLLLGFLLAPLLSLAALAPLPVAPDITVAADGSGDFTSLHAAVQSIPRDNRERKIIFVKDGLYTEKVRVDAACVTIRGQSRAGTRLEFAWANPQGRDERGNAVLNLGLQAHDFVLENLTVKNTDGQLGIHAFAVFGMGDRTVITDCDILSQGNDTLSLWRGRAETAAQVAGAPPPDPTINKEAGRYYHARLNVCGSVDFICPRGWCYMADSTITEVNPGSTASVWHDGSNVPDKKFVLRGCTFDGPASGWTLARRHHDAHFYFVDCSFAATMRDKSPYRVIYPLNGGEPSEADKKRNADYDKTNVYGERAYYFNSHHAGGDYAWHQDNLASAPGAPKPEQITAKWTFAGTWDPERTDVPRIVALGRDEKSGHVTVTFSERVTVKGKPRLVFSPNEATDYAQGSGTAVLEFPAAKSFGGRVPRLDLNGGAIVACEAAATLRVADVKFP
jgi:pectinesterase